MNAPDLITQQVVAGILLILSGLIFLVAGMLYTGRAIWKRPAAQTPGYLRLERGFVMAALLVSVVGFTLLERRLEAAGEAILAPAGLVILVIAAALILVAETYALSRQEWLYAPIVAHVFLAFLAQAIFAAAILRSGLLPAWVGWAALVWSLIWPVVLPIARPRDMYYPWLHYVAPLLIGISLLLKR